MRHIKWALVIPLLIALGYFANSSLNKYPINSEYCWLDINFAKTQRIGLSLKVLDKKNNEIQYLFTHVMAHAVLQNMVGTHGVSSGSSSIAKFEQLIEENTLDSATCTKMHSIRDKISQVLEDEVKKEKINK